MNLPIPFVVFTLRLIVSFFSQPLLLPNAPLPPPSLSGLVVKASASRAEDPGFKSRLRRDFFRIESYQGLKNWRYGGYPARRLGAEDSGFESRLRRDFSGSSHTGDSKIGAPVATLPGAWRYRVSAGTGWPGVSIL